MKKHNIVIAVFAMIAATSSAMAQSKSVDFDGRSSKTSETALSALMVEPNPRYDIPLPQIPDMEQMPGQLPPCGELSILPWPLPCNNTPQLPPDCSQTPSNTWWWIAVCGNETPIFPDPVYLDTLATWKNKAVSVESSKNSLTQLLLGYSNAYPEFAASIMPVLKGKNVSIVYDSKGVYIMSGTTIARLDFEKLSRMTPASTSSATQNKIAPALEAALLIAENVHTWYNVYQAWSEGHSSDNTNDGSSMNPQDAHDIQNNIQRMRPAR